MNCRRSDPLAIQCFRNALPFPVWCGKDQALAALFTEKMAEELLFISRQKLQTPGDARSPEGLRVEPTRGVHGSPRVVLHQGGPCPLPSSRKTQRLTLFWKHSTQFCESREENPYPAYGPPRRERDLQVAKLNELAIEIVLKPTGSRNDTLAPLRMARNCCASANPPTTRPRARNFLPRNALYCSTTCIASPRVGTKTSAASPGFSCLSSLSITGIKEREGLTSPGLRRRQHVLTLKRLGYRRSLNRRRRTEKRAATAAPSGT